MELIVKFLMLKDEYHFDLHGFLSKNLGVRIKIYCQCMEDELTDVSPAHQPENETKYPLILFERFAAVNKLYPS